MKRLFSSTSIIFLALISAPITGSAQALKSYTSSEIYLKLRKLNVLGNVLYVAAHPDDENTRLIAYLANDRLVNTAYLSITRGDGGQNLLGPEIQEHLGLIRTQELLAARRIDGGRQFFTRANDFGYSKNTQETQRIWNRDEVLKDVVWTYRKFRPDVVITRFPPDERAGHGHHTTSAVLAIEAFRISGNSSFYSNQLEFFKPWQPDRIFTNTGRWWRDTISEEDEGVIAVDVGGFNSVLGRSYTEIAAISRSQHKSQGFGATGSRGQALEYLENVDGLEVETDLFEGIDITWGRVDGAGNIQKMVESLMVEFDFSQPHLIVPGLVQLRIEISQLGETFWRDIKLKEVDELIRLCSGLYLEATADRFQVVPGEEIEVRVEVVKRSETNIHAQSIDIAGFKETISSLLGNNVRYETSLKIRTNGDLPVSNPYWLVKEGSMGMYRVDDIVMRGLPENNPSFQATVELVVAGEIIEYNVPIVYKWNDRVKGERRRPVVVVPPVMVSVGNNVNIFPNDDPKKVEIRVKAGTNNITPVVSLNLPGEWKSEPASSNVLLERAGEEKLIEFMVFPPSTEEDVQIQASARWEGKEYGRGQVIIDYNHFPIQTVFPKATARMVRADIETRGSVVGYISGAGDAIPESLERMGYTVRHLAMDDLTLESLSTVDAVVMGIRAVNTIPSLRNYKEILLKYVHQGGNLIYQYNTSRGIDWNDFAPYELGFTGRSSDSRVSVEEAEIRILLPEHAILNTPNVITSKDFEGWVQERGLYFPSTWHENYSAILSSNDPGEDPKNGGLLVTQYGDGFFVYTGYSWFRQLPAGVPGAYKLFANIVSLGIHPQQGEASLDPNN